jgi:hypothetical protein
MWFAEGGGDQIGLVGTGPPAAKTFEVRALVAASHGPPVGTSFKIS